MQQLLQLVRVHPLQTSVYDPQTNTLVECFNSMLKLACCANLLYLTPVNGWSGCLFSCLQSKKCHRPPPISHHSNYCMAGNQGWG